MILHVKSKKQSEVWNTWQEISQDPLYYLSHGLLVVTLIEGWALCFADCLTQGHFHLTWLCCPIIRSLTRARFVATPTTGSLSPKALLAPRRFLLVSGLTHFSLLNIHIKLLLSGCISVKANQVPVAYQSVVTACVKLKMLQFLPSSVRKWLEQDCPPEGCQWEGVDESCCRWRP